MAGTLVIDTLKASTGVLATQNGMSGIAKAWVIFGGGYTITAGSILASFNVSSITVNGTGWYTANFTTAMPSTSYSVQATSSGPNNATNQATNTPGYTVSTTSCDVKHWETGTLTNCYYMNMAIYI